MPEYYEAIRRLKRCMMIQQQDNLAPFAYICESNDDLEHGYIHYELVNPYMKASS